MYVHTNAALRQVLTKCVAFLWVEVGQPCFKLSPFSCYVRLGTWIAKSVFWLGYILNVEDSSSVLGFLFSNVGPPSLQCKEQREVFSRGQGSSDVNTTTYPHLALRSRMLMLPVIPSWRTQRQIYIFFTLCPWCFLFLCPLLTCCTSSKKEIRALLTKHLVFLSHSVIQGNSFVLAFTMVVVGYIHPEYFQWAF
jgi:hypothetical protein